MITSVMFNLYSVVIFNEAFKDKDLGNKVNGVYINNVRYAGNSSHDSR